MDVVVAVHVVVAVDGEDHSGHGHGHGYDHGRDHGYDCESETSRYFLISSSSMSKTSIP